MLRLRVLTEDITQIEVSWDVMSSGRYNYIDDSKEAAELCLLMSQQST
jgi:hypothetical protein